MSDPILPPPSPASGVPNEGPSVLVRFGARFIDGLIVGIPAAIVFGALGLLGNVLGAALITIAQVAYFTVMESGSGKTIGKSLLKIRVLGPDGGNPTQQQAFQRNAWLLLGIIPIIGGFATVGIAIWIAVVISSNPMGPHDGWGGGTRVVAETS